MNYTSLRQRLLAVALLEAVTLPVPLIAFAVDKPYITALSLLIFMIGSLVLPCFFYWRQQKKTGTSQYASYGASLYGTVLMLIAAIGVLNGILTSPLWHEYGWRVFFFFLWMIGTVAAQTVCAWAIAAWQKRLRSYWFSEFIDPLGYALPLPCAVLGMFMFPGSGEAGVTSSLIIGMLGIISLGFMVIGIFVMATFAFYFYPRLEEYPTKLERAIGIVRIIVMTICFLGIHYLFFYGNEIPFRLFLYYCLPLTQNNPLVFVSPFILESVIVIVSIAVSNLVILAMQSQRKDA